MKDRLFRARKDPRSPSDEETVGYDVVARRLGMSGRNEAGEDTDPDVAWDAPIEAPAATDEDAGGAPWDRPGDERFAPPSPHDLHWAFRAPDSDTPDWPAPEDRYGSPSHDEDRTWDVEADGGRGRAADGPWSWEDAPSLVTAGGGPRTEVPRDPAQPGLFDPYDAFAPVIADDGWTLPPRPERATAPITGQDPDPTPAPVPLSTRPRPAHRGSPGESVFGDLFAPSAARLDQRVIAEGTQAAGARDEAVVEARDGEEARASATPPATDDAPARPDPRDWPPIPSGLLPPIPQPAGSAPSVPSPEPDGRRFAWPPPQPRISRVSTEASDEGRPLPPSDQPTLWSRDRDHMDAAPATAAGATDERDQDDDVAGSTFASTTSESSADATLWRPSITLRVVAVAALTVGVMVLAAQFVLSLLR